MSLFAKNLRFLRKQRGLNQDEISALFKKRPNTIGNWENGKSEPGIGELIQLADYFKIGLQQLLQNDLQKEVLEDPAKTKELPEAQDGSQDSFWLILRELRSISEKLDDLRQTRESGLQKPGSDKSYH